MKEPWEVWNELLDKPRKGLTSVELTVLRVSLFLTDFEMGGWLYNISPKAGAGRTWKELRETAKAAEKVGDQLTSGVLVKIVGIVESASIQRTGTWESLLASADPQQRLAGLEKKLSKRHAILTRKLEKYTRAHLLRE